MRYPEILAPAGSMESVIAALRCGADAVYVGGKSFSARNRATNFTLSELQEAAALCHLYDAKLYLTVNTIIFQNEFSKMEAFVKDAASAGVDALLLQDIGVVHFIRNILPDMPLHASTQMTIHTREGALWAKEQGFSRVVVSRELSRAEVAKICQCDIEVEQFVHGALCMSVSGQCSLSAVIGSRSANRGRCAQACRLPFSAVGKNGIYALSLKDLCLVPYVSQMIQDGITSLKIEGRCKRPEYVAAAVTALVQARDGKEPDLNTLRAVFSRSGFTDGYYTGARTHMFGTRQKEDVIQTKTVLSKLENLYQKPKGIIPLSIHISVKKEQPVQIDAWDNAGNMVHIIGEIPQIAQTKPTNLLQLTHQMEKLGGTIYYLQKITAECDGITMLPASAWNALRRRMVNKMDTIRISTHTPQYTIQNKTDVLPPILETTWNAKPTFRIILPKWNDTAKQLLECSSVEAILLPITSDLHRVPERYKKNIFLCLPRFCPDETKVISWIKTAGELGYSHLLCENVSHIHIGAMQKFTLHAGFGLHAANDECLLAFREMGITDAILSPELKLTQTKCTPYIPYGIYAYGHQPVMLMRNCPIREEIGCKRCTHQLMDRTGRHFPIYCHPETQMTVMYNAVPTWMADKLHELTHAAFLVLDCSILSDPNTIVQAYFHQKKADFPITRGLFYRGVE